MTDSGTQETGGSNPYSQFDSFKTVTYVTSDSACTLSDTGMFDGINYPGGLDPSNFPSDCNIECTGQFSFAANSATLIATPGKLDGVGSCVCGDAQIFYNPVVDAGGWESFIYDGGNLQSTLVVRLISNV
jgi:hypothetical protein